MTEPHCAHNLWLEITPGQGRTLKALRKERSQLVAWLLEHSGWKEDGWRHEQRAEDSCYLDSVPSPHLIMVTMGALPPEAV
jgi:hypothetical protein